jgi:hypothetical protein
MAAEYMAASQATDELMHVTKLLRDFGVQSKPTILMQDNQATARSLENLIDVGKTKYLSVHFHYVRERVACGDLVINWVDSGRILADFFTKQLCSGRCLGSWGWENDRANLFEWNTWHSGVQWCWYGK